MVLYKVFIGNFVSVVFMVVNDGIGFVYFLVLKDWDQKLILDVNLYFFYFGDVIMVYCIDVDIDMNVNFGFIFGFVFIFGDEEKVFQFELFYVFVFIEIFVKDVVFC